MENSRSYTENDKIKIVTNSLKLIKSNLTCRICEKLFVEPVITNCGHVFCENCIQSYFEFKRRCPICNVCDLNRESDNKTIHLKNLIFGFERLKERCLLDIKHFEEREDISTESEGELEQEDKEEQENEEEEEEEKEEGAEKEEDEEYSMEIKLHKRKKRYFPSSGSDTTIEILSPIPSTSQEPESNKTKKKYFPSFGLKETNELLNLLSKTSSQVEEESENLISEKNSELNASTEENCQNENTKTTSISEKLSVTKEAELRKTKKRYFPSFGSDATTTIFNSTTTSSPQEHESSKTKKKYFPSFGSNETNELLKLLSKTSSQVEGEGENLISDKNSELSASTEENCQNENAEFIFDSQFSRTSMERNVEKMRRLNETEECFKINEVYVKEQHYSSEREDSFLPGPSERKEISDVDEYLDPLEMTTNDSLQDKENSEANLNSGNNSESEQKEGGGSDGDSDFEREISNSENNLESEQKEGDGCDGDSDFEREISSCENEPIYSDSEIVDLVTENINLNSVANLNSQNNNLESKQREEIDGDSEFEKEISSCENVGEPNNSDPEIIDLVTETINLNSQNINLESERREDGDSELKNEILPPENVGDLETIKSEPEIIDLDTETVDLVTRNINFNSSDFESEQQEESDSDSDSDSGVLIQIILKFKNSSH